MQEKKQFKNGNIKSSVTVFINTIRGIRMKLILAYSLPILLFIIFGAFSYSEASKIIIENYTRANMNMIKKTGEFYEILFQTVDGKSQKFASNPDVRNYYSGLYKNNPQLENEIFSKINGQAIAESLSDENVKIISIMSPYGQLAASSGLIEKNVYKEYMKNQGEKIVGKEKGKAIWEGKSYLLDDCLNIPKNQYGITISRQIINNQMNSVGILVMDVQMDSLMKPMISTELPQGSKCAFITSDGREITSEGESESNYFFGEDFYKEVFKSQEKQGIQQLNYNNQEYLYAYYKVGDTGCMLGTLIPEDQIIKQADKIKKMTIIIVVIATFIAGIVSAVLAKGIGSEINKINNAVKKVSDGDLTVVCNTKRRDEFNLLSKNISGMLKNMKKLINKTANVSSLVTYASESLSQASVKLVKSSKNITGIFEEMDKGIGRQAEDAKICLSKMETLGEKITSVNEGTIKISKFAIDTKEIVDGGILIIEELSEKAGETSKITWSVIDNIENLEKESVIIGSIIDTMNSIAKQTNLLALNASIEAERAGSYGKGFSVVAEEIKKLANESLKASNKISEIINEIKILTQNTAETAKKAEKIVASQDIALQRTIQVFNCITQHVDDLTSDIKKISLRIKDIEITKDETKSSIGNISHILKDAVLSSTKVQRLVSLQLSESELLNLSAEELRNYSSQLEEAINNFKI